MNYPILKLHRFLIYAFFIPAMLVVAGYSSPAFSDSHSVGCNDSFVALAADELAIIVKKTGTDDTVNIQCALDAAVIEGIPVVRLEAGNYFISSILIEDFKGTLEGRSKTATVVTVLNNSVDCAAMSAASRTSTVIKFINGEPRVRSMKVTADHPCMGSGRISNIFHFTGGPADSTDCSNDVIFGAVDRVVIDGLDPTAGPFVAISVWPESDNFLSGCKFTLLGTFKLNRSEISNTLFGLMTTMKGGAQVDVNFNDFHNNQIAVYFLDSNQNTTVVANKFYSTASVQGLYDAISVATFTPTAPTITRVVVHNNQFNISTANGGTNVSVVGVQDPVRTNVSLIVTNNTFNLEGVLPWGVFYADASNGHVSANTFTGSGNGAVFISGTSPVSGWTITANKGLGNFASDNGGDIALGSNTSDCIIGPGQNATIIDQGSNNSVLSNGTPSPSLNDMATEFSSLHTPDASLLKELIYTSTHNMRKMHPLSPD